MTAVLRLVWNPIVEKEVRSRMRSWRAPTVITLYLAVLGGIGYAVYSQMTRSLAPIAGYSTTTPATLGIGTFALLTALELLLIAFITPGLTAGAISGERERQTFDLLLCTRVRPAGIVLGKLIASLLFVLLMLLISVPLFSVVFLLGGVELDQVLSIFVIGLVTALTLGTLGLFCSAVARRSTAATVSSYGLALLLLFGTLLAGFLFPATYNPASSSRPAPPVYVLASPITALAASLPSSPVTPNGFLTLPPFVKPVPVPLLQDGIGYSSSAGVNSARSSMTLVQPYRSLSAPDIIPSGPFAHWHAWQAFAALNLGLVAIVLTLTTWLVSSRTRRALPIRGWGRR
jgi:ABC-type transport system involved in multi-copper enzyme maturation permease subunit